MLLNLQDEIVALERELDDLDQFHEEAGDAKSRRRLKSRSLDANLAKKDQDDVRPRSEILSELQTKLIAYGTFLVEPSLLRANRWN